MYGAIPILAWMKSRGASSTRASIVKKETARDTGITVAVGVSRIQRIIKTVIF